MDFKISEYRGSIIRGSIDETDYSVSNFLLPFRVTDLFRKIINLFVRKIIDIKSPKCIRSINNHLLITNKIVQRIRYASSARFPKAMVTHFAKLRLINFETRINLAIYLIYFMDKTLGKGILLITNK